VVIRQAFGITLIEVRWTDDLTLHTKVAEGEIEETSLFVVSELCCCEQHAPII
jgi:hypothetical protein